MCALCGEIFSMDKPQRKAISMAFSLSSLNMAEIQADLAKVEEVVAIVEKYDGALPLPASVKTGVTDLDNALKFAESVLSQL